MALSRQAVLVGFAESLAAIECVWSLQRAGMQVSLFTRRGQRSGARRLPDVRTYEIASPSGEVDRSIADLSNLLGSQAWACVMPLDDEAVWLLDQAGCRATGVPVAGPTGAFRQLALDKRLQLVAAADAGFQVPPTVVAASRDTTLPAELGEGPFVVKPALAVSHIRGRLEKGRFARCPTRRDVARATATATPQQPLLVQVSLAGIGEGVFGLADGESAEFSGHRRVRMMNPAGSGASACTARQPEPHEITATTSFLDSSQWRGLFMIELLRDEQGTAWFMELNGRPWGSMALARRRGLEYPAWAVQQLLSEPRLATHVQPVDESLVCRHLGREVVHLAHVLRGPKEYQPSWPSRRAGARAVLRLRRGERWYNARRDRPAVLLSDTWFTVRQQLRRSR